MTIEQVLATDSSTSALVFSSGLTAGTGLTTEDPMGPCEQDSMGNALKVDN